MKQITAVTDAADVTYTGEKWSELFAMAIATPGFRYMRWKLDDMANHDVDVHDSAHYIHIVHRLYSAGIEAVLIPSYKADKLFSVFVKGDKMAGVKAARLIHDVEETYCRQNPDKRPAHRRAFDIVTTPAFYC